MCVIVLSFGSIVNVDSLCVCSNICDVCVRMWLGCALVTCGCASNLNMDSCVVVMGYVIFSRTSTRSNFALEHTRSNTNTLEHQRSNFKNFNTTYASSSNFLTVVDFDLPRRLALDLPRLALDLPRFALDLPRPAFLLAGTCCMNAFCCVFQLHSIYFRRHARFAPPPHSNQNHHHHHHHHHHPVLSYLCSSVGVRVFVI